MGYNREIRYRLESKGPPFAHDRIHGALRQLVREGKIKEVKLPGRKKRGVSTNIFYTLPGTKWEDLLDLMREKFELSVFISGVSSEMGRYAECLWWKAFKENGWEVFPRSEEESLGINEWKGKKAQVNNDIDFVAIKDGIEYGVEIKNGLGYPRDLYWKVKVALDLDLIPFIIARWLDPAQINVFRRFKIPFVVYKTAIFTPTYKELVEKAIKVLNVPIECRERIDREYFEKRVEAKHRWVKEHLKEVKRSLEELKEELQDPEKEKELKRALRY